MTKLGLGVRGPDSGSDSPAAAERGLADLPRGAMSPEAMSPEAMSPEAVPPGAVLPEAMSPEAVPPAAVRADGHGGQSSGHQRGEGPGAAESGAEGGERSVLSSARGGGQATQQGLSGVVESGFAGGDLGGRDLVDDDFSDDDFAGLEPTRPDLRRGTGEGFIGSIELEGLSLEAVDECGPRSGTRRWPQRPGMGRGLDAGSGSGREREAEEEAAHWFVARQNDPYRERESGRAPALGERLESHGPPSRVYVGASSGPGPDAHVAHDASRGALERSRAYGASRGSGRSGSIPPPGSSETAELGTPRSAASGTPVSKRGRVFFKPGDLPDWMPRGPAASPTRAVTGAVGSPAVSARGAAEGSGVAVSSESGSARSRSPGSQQAGSALYGRSGEVAGALAKRGGAGPPPAAASSVRAGGATALRSPTRQSGTFFVRPSRSAGAGGRAAARAGEPSEAPGSAASPTASHSASARSGSFRGSGASFVDAARARVRPRSRGADSSCPEVERPSRAQLEPGVAAPGVAGAAVRARSEKGAASRRLDRSAVSRAGQLIVAGLAAGVVAGLSVLPILPVRPYEGLLQTDEGPRFVEANVRGAVARVLVEPGQEVTAGDPVVEIESLELYSDRERSSRQLASMRTEFEQAQQEAEAVAGRRDQLLAQRRNLLRRRLELKDAELSARESRLAEVRRLFARGSATQAHVSEALAALHAAREGRLAISADMAELELEKSLTRSEGAAGARTRRLDLVEAEADLWRAERLLELTTVRSPIDGWVESVAVARGSVVQPMSHLVRVLPKQSPTRIVAFMGTEDFDSVAEGVDASVEIVPPPRGSGGELAARVVRVSREVASPAAVQALLARSVSDPVVRVELELLSGAQFDRLEPQLRAGTPVHVYLHSRRHSFVDVVSRAVERWTS